ncbi:Armadillo [Trinorchestia longiramus]|nr:Armadillo [Trinorchestia longiramus]
MHGETQGTYVPLDWDEEEAQQQDEGEEEEQHHIDVQHAEQQPEYWLVHKLVKVVKGQSCIGKVPMYGKKDDQGRSSIGKYLKVGDETCSLLALVGLKECTLTEDSRQLALQQSGGIAVLLNILRTNSLKCIAVQQLVQHKEVQVRGLAASVLAKVCRQAAARNVVVRSGAVSMIVELIRLDPRSSTGMGGGVTAAGGVVSATAMVMAAVEAAGRAVWALSVSAQGRAELLRAGVLTTLPLLLQYNSVLLQQSVIGTLHQCLVEPVYRELVDNSGLASALIGFLQDRSERLQCLAAQALARGSKLDATRTRLCNEGGLEVLVQLLKLEAEPYIIEKTQRRRSQHRSASIAPPDGTLHDTKKQRCIANTELRPQSLAVFCLVHLETRVPHTSLESLKAKLQREWEAIPQEHKRAACDAFTSGLEEAPSGGTEGVVGGGGHPDAGHQVRARSSLATPSGKDLSLHDGRGDESETAEVDAEEESAETKALSEAELQAQEEALAEEGGELRPSELLEAVTAVLWHVVCSPQHVEALKTLDAIPALVVLLDHPNQKVVSQVAGALAEAAVSPECCAQLVAGDGVPKLVVLLRRTAPHLLLNVTRALRSCAQSPAALQSLLQQDGLRLLWSHLKSEDHRIQASAASAICTCLHQEPSGLAEEVRSLGGGIELLVALLESSSEAVLSAACAAIARIAVDPRNLAIMTDYGAVTCLSKLAVRMQQRQEKTHQKAKGMTATARAKENSTLRPFLAEAIAACCISRDTGLLFGRAGAVAPLVQYLETSDSQVRRPTCRALHRLSLEPENCVTLHQSGAVPLLLEMLSSNDDVVQEAAADCLRNIRLLALQRCRGRGVVPVYHPSSK